MPQLSRKCWVQWFSCTFLSPAPFSDDQYPANYSCGIEKGATKGLNADAWGNAERSTVVEEKAVVQTVIGGRGAYLYWSRSRPLKVCYRLKDADYQEARNYAVVLLEVRHAYL